MFGVFMSLKGRLFFNGVSATTIIKYILCINESIIKYIINLAVQEYM